MEKTENFNLNKPEPTDLLRVEDFNENADKVDAALGDLAAAKETLTAAVSKCGNCKIVYGSYVGNGNYNSSGANTLTFAHKPLLVAVMPKSTSDSSVKSLLMVRDSPIVYTYAKYYESKCTVTWAKKSVSWYGTGYGYQFNESGITYHYVALLAADE